MLNIFINLLLFVHVIVSLLIIVAVLMQRPKNEGLGAAFGAGMTDSLFGAQTTNVLASITRWLGALFFILTLVLSALYARQGREKTGVEQRLQQAPKPVVAPQEENKPAEVKADAAAPAEAPKVPAEAPKVPAEAPKVPAEAPKAPAEAPKVPAEAPKAPAEAPKVPAEAPKVPAEAPKVPAEAPKAPAEAPKAPAEAPKAPAEAPKVPAEAPKAPSDAPKNSPEPQASLLRSEADVKLSSPPPASQPNNAPVPAKPEGASR